MNYTEFITHAQMEQFLKTQSGSTPEEACSRAIQHFQKNGLCRKTPPRISSDCDIILVSDDDFIEMCNELPINSFFLEDNCRLTAAALFPPNYECFVVRHLNSLFADTHHHDFFEICYVWTGSCLQTTSEQTFSMEPGDFLIIPPGIDHTVNVTSSETVLFNIMVRKDAFRTSSFSLLSQNFAISEFLRHCLLKKDQENCLLIHTDNSVILKRIVKHLTQECYTMQDVFCDFAINIFNQLFCCILLSGEVKAQYLCLPDNFSVIAILYEMQQNYQTVTLKSLSDKFYFSEEHLSRLIKKATGRTFSVLLRETRINQAKLLVARTELSIEQIGELVGYSDSSSFTKAFKASLGQSPAQYRKLHRTE